MSVTPIQAGTICQRCGYDLRGLTGEVCPECGRSLAGVRAQVSQIPWIRRQQIGRLRAFWETIRMVMFDQHAFCDELGRPVDYAEAQRFRCMTVLHAAGPVAIAMAVMLVLHGQRLVLHWRLPSTWWLMGLAAGLWLHLVLFLIAATGVPSYFYHPRSCSIQQQNRAIALGYYSSGPLTLLFAAALAFAVASPEPARHEWQLFLQLLGWLLGLATMAVWWLDLVHLARRLMPQRPQRVWLVAVSVPLLWLGLAAATLVILPLAWGYLAIVLSGLWL